MNRQKLSGTVKKIFFLTGVYRFIRKVFPASKVAILRYHAVVEPKQNFYTSPSIALSPAEFERQVRYFSRNYNILSMDQLVDHVQQKQPLPPNSVVFTFDDGYSDNFHAAMILKKYGAGGTFYITTEPIGRKSLFWLSEVTCVLLKTDRRDLTLSLENGRHHFLLRDRNSRWNAIREIIRIIKSNNREVRETIRSQIAQQLGSASLLKTLENLILTWDQVREMIKMGMIIGSHTLTHLNLPNAEPQDAVQEIVASKDMIEKRIAKKIRHFSYPNSGPYDYFNERIKEYVIQAGYDSSSTSKQGFVGYQSDLFALERLRTVSQLEEVIHTIEWDRLFT